MFAATTSIFVSSLSAEAREDAESQRMRSETEAWYAQRHVAASERLSARSPEVASIAYTLDLRNPPMLFWQHGISLVCFYTP
jgi:hypothetical protein